MTKILLVEDDKSLREIYGVRLLAEGYDIVSAGDGEEALAMAIKEKPQLIVSDVMMPKISGFDMLDILRSTTETRDIKVIMMTALSSDDQRTRGEQLGADRYLVKSQVGIEDVVRTVHDVLGDSAGAPAATPATEAPSDPQTTETPAAPTTEPAAAPVPTPPAQEEESSLPQPTAPFSSPRPATLGERVINPIDTSDAQTVTSSIASQIEHELKAPTDPVASTQVDDNAPLSPVADPNAFAQPAAAPAPSFDQAPQQSESAPESPEPQEQPQQQPSSFPQTPVPPQQ